jgi:hypothetical protein
MAGNLFIFAAMALVAEALSRTAPPNPNADPVARQRRFRWMRNFALVGIGFVALQGAYFAMQNGS